MIESKTHRVVRIDGEPWADWAPRHIVIGAIASHRAWQSLGTEAKRVVSALTGAIAIAYRRICDWLGGNFDSPHGLAFYVAVLFPITIAAFCIGYFGLRELLAGFGL